jgi:hydrogenase expression/formation protein HypE
MKDSNGQITLNHGSGGRSSHELIKELFLKYFDNQTLSMMSDAAIIDLPGQRVAFTTDGFVIKPQFFPGGNIGKLSICGTVNDLAVSGAKPFVLSASFIIEEGFSMNDLDTIVSSMAAEAKKADVAIVTGDTKVVEKGMCDGIFITTTGIGIVGDRRSHIAAANLVVPGDLIIVNGTLGDHSIAILSQRQTLGFKTDLVSDCACLNGFIDTMQEYMPEVHFMRDVTRGGLTAVVYELMEKSGVGIELYESKIPVKEPVASACELFGYDVLSLANEGKFITVISEAIAGPMIEAMHSHELGKDAAIIGKITADHSQKAILHTVIGGKRILDMPSGTQLPRIC